MTKPIETTFEELTFELIEQLVERAEAHTDKIVTEVWIDRYFVTDIIRKMANKIDPITERTLVLDGNIGEFETLKNRPVLRQPSEPADFDTYWKPKHIWGLAADGTRLFDATLIIQEEDLLNDKA